MSYNYSPDEIEKFIDNEQAGILKKKEICQKVIDTINTDGWKETVAPLIDRMITDVVGGKVGDDWVSGKLDRAKKEERREFYIGYKQALIELHQRILFHKAEMRVLDDKYKRLEKDRELKLVMPSENSRYNPNNAI